MLSSRGQGKGHIIPLLAVTIFGGVVSQCAVTQSFKCCRILCGMLIDGFIFILFFLLHLLEYQIVWHISCWQGQQNSVIHRVCSCRRSRQHTMYCMMHQINYWPLSFEGVYICTRRRRRRGQCEIVALKINTDFEKKERNRDTHTEKER